MAEQPPAKTKDEAVSLMKGADASVEETTPNSNLKPTKPSTPQTSTAGPSTVETLPSSTKRRRPPQVVTKPTTIPPTAETAPPVPARTKPSQKPPPIQEKSKTPTTMVVVAVIVVVVVVIGAVVGIFCLVKKCRKEAPAELPMFHPAQRVLPVKKAEAKNRGPMPGENFKANEWVYRGALELQLKPPTDEEVEAHFAMMARESETDVPAVKSTDHVQFDPTMNEVWEMGSEVEKVYYGDKLLPPKPRSSMPSKYANAGAKIQTQTKEQMRDKAIREA